MTLIIGVSGIPIRRLQNVSTISVAAAGFQQPDRPLERRRAQVHVALRRDQILVAGQLLDRPCRRPPHRQMRAERMAQAMHPALGEPRPSRRPFHVVLHHIRGERRAVATLSEDEILQDFPQLERDDVRACLAYAAERERRTLGIPAA